MQSLICDTPRTHALDMAEMQPMPREWPNTQTQRAAWERMQRDDQFLRLRQAALGGRAHLLIIQHFLKLGCWSPGTTQSDLSGGGAGCAAVEAQLRRERVAPNRLPRGAGGGGGC